MRVLSWNIRHGGSPGRDASILAALVAHDADIVILSEYRTGRPTLRSGLEGRGWTWTYAAEAGATTNVVLVASKRPLLVALSAHQPAARHRWVEVEVPVSNLRLLGVHIPGSNDRWDKRAFWEATLSYAMENAERQALIIGDLNTGLPADAQGTPFTLSGSFAQLSTLGWVDLWRDFHAGRPTEFTWYSTAGNGFRVDHAFASPALRPHVREARYSHAERLTSASDHSILTVDIDR